jgi:hypothetical protein
VCSSCVCQVLAQLVFMYRWEFMGDAFDCCIDSGV